MLIIEKTNIELAEGYSRTISSMYLRTGDSSIIILQLRQLNDSKFILIVSMWVTRLLNSTLPAPSFKSMTTAFRNCYLISKSKINDCVFMQCKMQSLVPNFFIHNIRELLEKMSQGKEMGSLAQLMELSLINQSKLSCRVILKQDGSQSRVGNQFRTNTK